MLFMYLNVIFSAIISALALSIGYIYSSTFIYMGGGIAFIYGYFAYLAYRSAYYERYKDSNEHH